MLGLDLVEIVSNVIPPVCKIMDYSKHYFQKSKKRSAVKKKSSVIQLKEIKMRPTIEEEDYKVKLKNITKFICSGKKVKVMVIFKGREISHQELGVNILKRLENDLLQYAKIERLPKMDGRQMFMFLGPKK